MDLQSLSQSNTTQKESYLPLSLVSLIFIFLPKIIVIGLINAHNINLFSFMVFTPLNCTGGRNK